MQSMFSKLIPALSIFACHGIFVLAAMFSALSVAPLAQAEIDPCPTVKSWAIRSQAGESKEPDFYKEQTSTLLEWLAEEPENAKFWAMLGMAAEAHGHNHAIKAAMETLPLIGTVPDEVIESMGVEVTKFKRNRQDFAVAAWRNAIEYDDKLVAPWFGIGSIRMDQENYEEAVRYFKEAANLAQSPVERVMVMFGMAQALEQGGKREESEEIKSSILVEVVKMGGLDKMQEMNLDALIFPECAQ